jgi:UDP-3-O-[3-hydroxymyristoyl] glucosamine N-acyltransferase
LVSISPNCQIGARCEIKSNTAIGSYGFGFARDEQGLNHHVPHYGGVIMGDDVHIGSNCSIDGGTFAPSVIGSGTKIDNQCHVGHNATIGKNVIITAGFIMAGSSTIGDNCVFAGSVCVNGHISIAANCTFAPLTAVSSEITEPGVYGGYPPIPFKEHLKAQASLQNLPKMRRSITRILAHLGLKESES